jgi:hypothetical protein
VHSKRYHALALPQPPPAALAPSALVTTVLPPPPLLTHISPPPSTPMHPPSCHPPTCPTSLERSSLNGCSSTPLRRRGAPQSLVASLAPRRPLLRGCGARQWEVMPKVRSLWTQPLASSSSGHRDGHGRPSLEELDEAGHGGGFMADARRVGANCHPPPHPLNKPMWVGSW